MLYPEQPVPSSPVPGGYYAQAIATPRYAGFWRRFLAAEIIDGLILGAVIGLIGVPFGVFGATFVDPATGAVDTARLGNYFSTVGGYSAFSSILYVLYDAVLIAFWHGQTLGKKVCGVRVVTLNGGPVSFGAALGRSAMKLVSGWILDLGYLWMLWDPRKQTWHDKVANTLVVRE